MKAKQAFDIETTSPLRKVGKLAVLLYSHHQSELLDHHKKASEAIHDKKNSSCSLTLLNPRLSRDSLDPEKGLGLMKGHQ